ncbi:MAG: endo alpha-1,4 polygalactosaminidase [Proteobacteria bacterium]|nr:endo alpha-1,4 polygalactosaminidase [Pseudomonadota bacterium]MCP4921827.1 endo alpha-1,4 polygalactosaminidase [Pseudomonadota bacterium]
MVYMDGACVGFEKLPEDEDPAVDVWAPEPGATWQWQISGAVDTSLDVDVYDIDLFDPPDSTYDALQDKGLVCYFSAGSWEDWRDDATEFPDEALGNDLDGWPGERWLDIRSEPVRNLMAARLDVAVSRGCDAVEPDNVDGYTNDPGFDLSYADQREYNLWLADQAHERGLGVALKNDLDQLEDLVDDFDFIINESCHEYDECGRLAVFTDAGKAALVAEYVDDWDDAQDQADAVCDTHEGLSTIVKTWDLDELVLACP